MNLIESCLAIGWLLFGSVILAVMIAIVVPLIAYIKPPSHPLPKKRSRSAPSRKVRRKLD